jgi:hypothetical protein
LFIDVLKKNYLKMSKGHHWEEERKTQRKVLERSEVKTYEDLS